MAEGVEEVAGVKYFETMIQSSGFCRINIAASATHTNNSCTKFDGPDFFNTLSQQQTLFTQQQRPQPAFLGPGYRPGVYPLNRAPKLGVNRRAPLPTGTDV